MRLDKLLSSQFTYENYLNIFEKLLKSKTDSYTYDIKLPMGVDGIDYKNIKNNSYNIARAFNKRALSGKYIFKPFREIQIPKSPYTKNEFYEAKRNNKLRTLSISGINDTIFQSMIYDSIYNYSENKMFKELDNNIFGYRKGKSVYMAIEQIKKYFEQGYVYGFDGDIEKYFDEIDHIRMKNKITTFFKNDPMVVKYLSRFLKSKKVTIENKKKVSYYYNNKPFSTIRTKGIPQGGVLSGLLANLYLNNFDKYIVNNIGAKYDLKYIRYADDFIVLLKTKDEIISIYNSIKSHLKREKLNLHDIDTSAISDDIPNKNKTKAINLDKIHYIDFLGFRISPKYVGIKADNILKFKKNIVHIINNSEKGSDSLQSLIYKINSKILGNVIYGKRFFSNCRVCGLPQKPQSWMAFFIGITDLRILKNLDKWIRKELHNYYVRTNNGKRLNKRFFKDTNVLLKGLNAYNYDLQSLYRTYIYMKKWFSKNNTLKFCKCDNFVPEFDISFS